MLCAVVPAHNEAGRIVTVLQNLITLPLDHIVLIVNGSCDDTLKQALSLHCPKLQVVHFSECLGIDIPRAIGAKLSYDLGANAVLFVDGDMVGTFNENLAELLQAVTLKKMDMALTNCYPVPLRHIERYNPTFQWRRILNQELGLEDKIGLSTPSHGPHAVSRKLLETISLRELAIPPVSLTLARIHKLNIDIGTTLPHYRLGSSIKSQVHSNKIIDTIVGDCLEAISLFHHQPRNRLYRNKNYVGYHCDRRFDLLDDFIR